MMSYVKLYGTPASSRHRIRARGRQTPADAPLPPPFRCAENLVWDGDNLGETEKGIFNEDGAWIFYRSCQFLCTQWKRGES